jgi:hypothetical protein
MSKTKSPHIEVSMTIKYKTPVKSAGTRAERWEINEGGTMTLSELMLTAARLILEFWAQIHGAGKEAFIEQMAHWQALVAKQKPISVETQNGKIVSVTPLEKEAKHEEV